MVDEGTASFLDKTDWRKPIQQRLEDAALSRRNPFIFFQKVESLVDTISAQYPGWNAELQIQKNISANLEDCQDKWNKWRIDNPTAKRSVKRRKLIEINMELNYNIFKFIKNLCGRRRMLLLGDSESKAVGYEDLTD